MNVMELRILSPIMPPMARRLFTLAAVVSLMMAAGTVALWVGSYRFRWEHAVDYRGERCRVILGQGTLRIDNAPAVEAANAPREIQLLLISRAEEWLREYNWVQADSVGKQRMLEKARRLKLIELAEETAELNALPVVSPWARSSALILPGAAAVLLVAPLA